MTAPRVTTRATLSRSVEHPSLRLAARRLPALLLLMMGLAPATLLIPVGTASAAVPNVALGTAAEYAVLGGSTVTNTGASTLDGSLGVSPGSAITGFPPGIVLPPGTLNAANAAAAQAQSDLTVAYNDTAGRSVDATTTADLADLNLQPGVYAGPSKGALLLNGTLTLDGMGDPGSVFIFQTNSSLTTGTGSTVLLTNGAQECNIYWQVGSSATLGTGSVFSGNILALTSITVNTGVTVHGRALARNGAVTLDTDVFTRPTCAQAPVTTTTSPIGATTIAGGGPTTIPGGGATTVAGQTPTTARPPIPNTGGSTGNQLAIAGAAAVAGTACVLYVRRRRTP